ncbi:MAG TPA: lipoate--protein ligase family protein [Verrucomicrobiae bacterium]
MQLLDLSYPEPARNLACDEALLNWCEAHQRPVMRFWESPVPFVVLGYANRVAKEVDKAACERAGVPVLRRCSGGGTVLQGPGCISYALVLPLDYAAELRSISDSNSYIMAKNANAIHLLLSGAITVEGHTDLVWKGRKFSGNSQRRTKNALLFHGTFLLKYDLALVEQTLQMPLLQPDYRKQRSHTEFVANIPITGMGLKSALRQEWQVSGKFTDDIESDMQALLAEKYDNPQWHEKF